MNNDYRRFQFSVDVVFHSFANAISNSFHDILKFRGYEYNGLQSRWKLFGATP